MIFFNFGFNQTFFLMLSLSKNSHKSDFRLGKTEKNLVFAGAYCPYFGKKKKKKKPCL